MVLFVFPFYPVCNFGKFINFVLSILRSETVKKINCFGARSVNEYEALDD